MPEKDKPGPLAIDPPIQDKGALCRETFLASLPPEQAAAARLFGRFFLLCFWESSYSDWSAEKELLGIAEDLEVCSEQLRAYAADHSLPGLKHPIKPWQEKLAALAGEIREAVDEESAS